MYLLHLFTSTVSQNRVIPAVSSDSRVGFTSRLMYSFSSCHRFSMGFKSGGDSGGVFHQLMFSFSKNAFAILDICLGSLSCMNRWESGYLRRINGSKPLCRIDTYTCRSAFIVPLNITIGIGPLLLIPAHTCTVPPSGNLTSARVSHATRVARVYHTCHTRICTCTYDRRPRAHTEPSRRATSRFIMRS